MIPIQILRVLSTIQQYDVRALLMGGQACVLYGAAEYSRDLDLAVLATETALPRLRDALLSLHATVIAVPPFEMPYLTRGHAVHWSVPDENETATSTPLRVDLMSRMRGVAPFDELWARRTTVTLPDAARSADVNVELMALEDLVAAKKTQRDKDWPMLRRLVDADYDSARDTDVTAAQATFWLSELRSAEFLREAVERFALAAAKSARPAVLPPLRVTMSAKRWRWSKRQRWRPIARIGHRFAVNWNRCVMQPDERDFALDGRFVLLKSRGGDHVVINLVLNWIAEGRAQLGVGKQ